MAAPQRTLADVSIVDVSIVDTALDAELTAEKTRPANDEPPQKTGKRLATARLEKGLTLNDVFAATKIKTPLLVAIEADDHAALPATPFAAGFVKAYAQFLGLDPESFSSAWRREAKGESVAPAPTAADPPLTGTPAPIVARAPAAAIYAKPKPSLSRESQNVIAYTAMAATAVAIAVIAANSLAVRNRNAPENVAPPGEAQSETAAPAPAAAATLAPPSVADAAPAIAPPAVIEIAAAAAQPTEPVAATPPPAPPPAKKEAAPTQPAPFAGAEPEAVVPPPVIETIIATPTPSATFDAPATSTPVFTPPVDDPPAADALAHGAPVVDTPAEDAAPSQAGLADATVSVDARGPKIVESKVVRSARPVYPERCASSAADIERVSIQFDIGADGRPANLRVVDASNPCFNSAAVDAASRMRFTPKKIDGAAVAETAKRVTIQFAG